jgi:diguanylate cyclase (GGDEF)-like protein/PAS domain S-box-containing protein
MMHTASGGTTSRFSLPFQVKPTLQILATISKTVSSIFHRLTHRTEHPQASLEADTVPTRLLALLDNTPDLVALYDVQQGLTYCNRAGRRLLQLAAEEWPDIRQQMTDPDSVTYLQETLFPIGMELENWHRERNLLTRNGHRIAVSQVVISHRDAQGRVAYLSTIARDISERKELDAQMQEQMALIQEQKAKLEIQKAELMRANKLIAEAYVELAEANSRLEMLATTDGLTGLKNHRAFQERLGNEFQRTTRYQTPLSLMLIDVDRFKQYNDAFGHPAGDEVLRAVAATLQSSARQTDYVARYGGEEFVLILPETDQTGAIEAAERVRHAIEMENWGRRGITVSIGVSSRRADTLSPALLIAEADKALYISKGFGRNCVTHHDALLSIIAQTCKPETAA